MKRWTVEMHEVGRYEPGQWVYLRRFWLRKDAVKYARQFSWFNGYYGEKDFVWRVIDRRETRQRNGVQVKRR